MMREKKAVPMSSKAAAKLKPPPRRRPDPSPPPPSPSPPPPPSRRSLRPRTATLYVAADYDSTSSEEERERERRKAKAAAAASAAKPRPRPSPAARKPARDPDSDSDSDSGSDSSSTSFSSCGEDDAVKPLKKRRINDGGSDEEPKKIPVRRSKGSVQVKSPKSTAKGTRLPDIEILEEVLDKLQKKDTYSVYAQPVDLEELPDYYEVIEHPMDFGTVRKKLMRSVYRTLEQFEDDVFLICSNAMQYNAPHTVYFKQARAIEEMARKNFQSVRDDAKLMETVQKSEEKIKFSSTEKKPLKQPLPRADKGSLGSDISSSGTLASAGDTCTGLSIKQSNGSNLRRAAVREKPLNSNGPSTPRTNVVKKAANSSGLCMSPDNAVSNPASANGLRKSHTSAVEKPAAFNRSSAARAVTVEKPLASKVLSTRQVDAVETVATADRSSTLQANAVGKPAIANGLTTTQANVVVKPATAYGFSTMQANAVEKSVTVHGSSTPQANAVEKAGNVHGLISPRANFIEKPAISNSLSIVVANAGGEPTPSNGSGEEQADDGGQPATDNAFAECGSPLDESRSEMADEFSARCSPSKLGRKPILVDENRRMTYSQSEDQSASESDMVLHVFDKEMKQLVDVGSHSEYSYAISLARFAAYLGPIGWEIASKKIEKALPAGIKFGRGWVGEYEPLLTPVLAVGKQTQQQLGYGSTLHYRGTETNKEIEGKSNDTKDGNSEDIQLCLKNQVNTGMAQRAYHPKGTIFCEQKQRLVGASAETQPRIVNAMLRQHKGQVAVGSTSEVSEQNGLCNSTSTSSIHAEKVLESPKLHSEAHRQRLLGASAEVQPKVRNLASQQKDQEVVDFTKAGTNTSKQAGVSNSSSVNNIPVEAALQRSQAQKQGMFFGGSVSQQRITNAMLHPQTDTTDIDIRRACNGSSQQLRVCNSASVNVIPAETSLQRDQSHFQSQKKGLFGVSAETQRRISNTMLQHQKDQAAMNLKSYNKVPEHIRAHNPLSASHISVEKDVQKTVFHSEAATNSWPQELIARNRNQLQPEHQKMAEPVISQSGKDALGLTVGGLSRQKVAGISDNRGVTSLDFNSNRPLGFAGYALTSGNRDRAADFRLMDLSGKISNQASFSNTNIYGANQVRSSNPPLTRDDSSATATKAWMSFGGSAECRSVDATSVHSQIGSVHSQIGSAPSYDSAWRNVTSAAKVNGDSTIRSSQVLPQSMPLVSEDSQNQNRGLVFFPQSAATDLSRFQGRPPWQGLSPRPQHRQMDTHPPDLNIGYQPPGSSGILVDSQQPDLALQL